MMRDVLLIHRFTVRFRALSLVSSAGCRRVGAGWAAGSRQLPTSCQQSRKFPGGAR